MIDLVIGGAASGKSEYAEKLVKPAGGARIYLATMYNDGSEAAEFRIARHRKLREGKGFCTLECPVHIERLKDVGQGDAILLEDLPNLLTNEMYLENRPADAMLDSLTDLNDRVGQLVIVTGQIFSDGRQYDSFTEQFIRNLAYLNQNVAALAACRSVTEVVCGIPVRLKMPE